MTPGYTVKGDKRYRYYVNTKSIKVGPEACAIRRVPAGEIEGAVMTHVRRVLQSPEVVASTLREVQALDPTIDSAQAIQTLQSTEAIWDELFPLEQAKIVQTLVERVTISGTGIKIDFRSTGIKNLLESALATPATKKAA